MNNQHSPNILSLLKSSLSLEQECPRPDLMKSFASVLVMLSHSDEKSAAENIIESLRVCFIKRTENKDDPWSGHYAFPGGRQDKGESLSECAVRETFEEVGVSVTQNHLSEEFFTLQLQHKGKALPYGVSAFSTFLPFIPNLSPCEKEVAGAYWLKVSDLINQNHHGMKNFAVGERRITRPCISFDGHVIWGISYMILKNLFGQLQNEQILNVIPEFEQLDPALWGS